MARLASLVALDDWVKGYMSLGWTSALAGSLIAGLVQGLVGFAFGLVALSFFAFVLEPAEAVIVVSGLAFAFALVGALKLYREVERRGLTLLVIGSILGTPLGVWLLTHLSAPILRRLIGTVLVAAVFSQRRQAESRWAHHRVAPFAVGVVSGVLGGAAHAAGPPVVLYAAGRGWRGRAAKANLQAFFVVNQGVILIGYASTGLVTGDVASGMLILGLPALVGFSIGWAMFNRIDELRFRQILWGMLLLSGLALFARG